MTAAFLAAGVSPGLGTTNPIAVRTSVSSRSIYFADALTVRVTVIVDRRVIRAASVHPRAAFGDWDRLAPTRETSIVSGPYQIQTWLFEVACLQTTCLPHAGTLRVEFPEVVVSATTVDGASRTVRRAWPSVSIAQRFGASTKGASPVFDLDQDLPKLTFRVDPTRLAYALDAAAALFGILAFFVVARMLLSRRPARGGNTPALARALMLVRQSVVRPADDRRRAVGLLARVLDRDRATSLSATASDLAWSAGEPSPERLEGLVEMVETEREKQP